MSEPAVNMKNSERVSEEGKLLGSMMAKVAERGRQHLIAQGLWDVGFQPIRGEMCASCACRPGTIPNGCLLTQMDFLKTVVQGDPFLCHAPKDGRLCAGWVAARAATTQLQLPDSVIAAASAWEYTRDDAGGEG